MATERRPYHLTPDSVFQEPWTNDEFAFISRLSAQLHIQWRTNRIEDPDEACRIVLRPGDLLRISGLRDLRSAWRLLWTVSDLVTLQISCAARASVVRESCMTRASVVHDRCIECASRVHPVQIYWPNWASVQRIASGHGGKRAPSSPLSESASASSVQKKEEEPAAPPLGTDLFGAAEKPKTRDFRAEARAAWPAAVAAAARHGKRWESLSEPRLVALAARLREYPDVPDLAVRLIDGAVAYWRKAKPKDADLTADLDPGTVFRASKAAKYLEHYVAGGVNGAAHTPASLEEAKRILDERRARDAELYREETRR